MANNCYNYLEITGENVIKFYNEFKNNEFDLIYQNLVNQFEKHGNNPRWFEIQQFEISDDILLISGDSAWSPALELFFEVAKKYDLSIKYTYFENGCDFYGRAVINKNEISDNCLSYWAGLYEFSDFQYCIDEAINEFEFLKSEGYTLDEIMQEDFYINAPNEIKNKILEYK